MCLLNGLYLVDLSELVRLIKADSETHSSINILPKGTVDAEPGNNTFSADVLIKHKSAGGVLNKVPLQLTKFTTVM